ncbi:MAG: serine acetyltransferase [Alphaproteobacteria bacterium]|nr:serine acetyltransferase [Alphaproteobacteria bacterium]MBT5728354.1 serine acetyltransferase [Alphaproteobacteria bacterium]
MGDIRECYLAYERGSSIMLTKLAQDIAAIRQRDPAASGLLSCILLYPSFHVMFAYRMAHPLWRAGLRLLPRFMMQIARWMTGIEIHPGAQIEGGFFADHGMGVVIGETSIVGKNVTLYHGVTLGGVMPAVDAQSQRCVKRHPTLEDNVIVGAGAQILGPITVGVGARVGGNSVVIRDVSAGQTVVGVPAKQLNQKRSDDSFDAYGVTDLPFEDSQARILKALFSEVEKLRRDLKQMQDAAGKDMTADDGTHQSKTAASQSSARPPEAGLGK